MIQPIIESLMGCIESLQILQSIYPLVEQKESEGKASIVFYEGKGQYQKAFNVDNYNGIGYFRLVADPTIARVDNQLNAASERMQVTYSLKFVAGINRDQLPDDCAFSDDGLAWEIAKQLTGNGVNLQTALNAVRVYILASKLSTDRKAILTSELPGNSLVDINYNVSLISVDFTITIEIEKSCITSICERFYGELTGCTTSVSVNPHCPYCANRLQGYDVSDTEPTEGQILIFTDGAWTPSDANTDVSCNSFQLFNLKDVENVEVLNSDSCNIYVNILTFPVGTAPASLTVYLPTDPTDGQVVVTNIYYGTVHTLVFDAGARNIQAALFVQIDNSPKTFTSYTYYYNLSDDTWYIMA